MRTDENYAGSYSAPVKKAAANQQYVGNGRTAPAPAKVPVYGNSASGFKGVPKVSHPAPRPPAPIRPPAVKHYAPTAPIKPSGKAIGSNKTGRITPIAPPKPKVAAKPIPQWSAEQDTTYQQQEAAARNALADYLAGQTNSQNQYNIENTRNTQDLAHNKELAYENLHDDYASRGMSASGMALKAYQDQSNDYARQQDVLNQGALNFGTTAMSQLGNFKSTQSIDSLRYRNDAINRHAAGLGLV